MTIPPVKPFIALDHVTSVYTTPGGAEFYALRDLSLEINEGEYVALLGANGSGKTTLARLMNGLLLPTKGKVWVNGLDTSLPSSRETVHSRVGMVFQSPNDQVIATVVEEDVAFGPENLGLAPAEILARVEQALRRVGLWEQRRRSPHALSGGQMQRLALAGVLAMRPGCVIFDESTSMLDPAGRRMVRDWMEALHADGISVIFITHFMGEAARADRVVVLDHGQVALDGPPAVVFSNPDRLTALGLEQPPALRMARVLNCCFPEINPNLLTTESLLASLAELPTIWDSSPEIALSKETCKGDIVLEAEHLDHIYMNGTPFAGTALVNANIRICAGEPHGLLGATGAGKTTMLQHLNGLLRPQRGSVKVFGQQTGNPATDLRAVRRQVGLVFQNPESMFFEQYVGDEIAYGPRQWGMDDLAGRVRRAMGLVGLDFEKFKDRLTFTLSGGERRKVALASTLALEPDALLLDEPTAGLDPIARRELLDFLAGLSGEGRAMALSSHQMGDVAFLTRRLTVFDHGHNVLEGLTGEVFARGDELKKVGLEPPLATQAAEVLRSRGWTLPTDIVTPEELTTALEARFVRI